MDKFKAGDTAYVIAAWTDNIVKCRIEKKDEDESKGIIYWYEYMNDVDKDGNDTEKAYGHYGSYENDLYKSAKEAYTARENKHLERQSQFMAQIRNVEDLMRFPLDNCFCGEEYTDHDAVIAYKQRTKELMGIDLECVFKPVTEEDECPFLMENDITER